MVDQIFSRCGTLSDLKWRTMIFLLISECVWTSKLWILSTFLHTLNVVRTLVQTRKDAIRFGFEVCLAFEMASRPIWIWIMLAYKSISMVYTIWDSRAVFDTMQWFWIWILPVTFNDLAQKCHLAARAWLRLFWWLLHCFWLWTSNQRCYEVLQLQIKFIFGVEKASVRCVNRNIWNAVVVWVIMFLGCLAAISTFDLPVIIMTVVVRGFFK